MKYKIYDLDAFGRGICKIDGKIHFVENALIGEEVEIEVIKEHKNYNVCKVKSVFNESDSRVKPKCKYYRECGGCQIMHMDYESQLEFKKNKVKNLLNKINYDKDIEIVLSPQFNYRNKINLHKNNEKVGLYKENTNDIVEIDECLIVKDSINREIKSVAKECIIRSNYEGEVFYNNEEFIDKIGDYSFYLNTNSFFQVNPHICNELFKEVKSCVKDSKNVLDLYCGVGVFSVVSASEGKDALGIELNKYAIKCANKNIELNNLKNIEFKCGKVEDIVSTLDNKFDTVIVDPPRKGLDNKTKEFINSIDNIIYISCEPSTLVRDLEYLSKYYKIEKIKLFDMFPNTYHVETFVYLKK